ncbi:MAG: DUF1592 domain-containing protein [Akkermansiaceae bacterium]|nr:DUF1592 domain-containing protein [Akkermansiaceae bacterium]
MRHFLFILLAPILAAGEVTFEKEIKPILEDYCFDCHGDGASKGDFSMDEYDDLSGHLDDVDHWLAVWRNVRSQIMPPPKKDQPDLAEKQQLMRWIEKRVFKLDPNHPDPGRVTIRRLNRVEYYYSIKDLLGVEYATWENFPADDTGYGFDTIGDVLSISPLHMEKYLEAASTVAEKALPKGTVMQTPVRFFEGSRFREDGDDSHQADWLEFKEERKVFLKGDAPVKGVYQVTLDYAIRGSIAATDQSARLELWMNGKKIAERTVGWDQRDTIKIGGQADLMKGSNTIEVRLRPKNPPGAGQGGQSAVLKQVSIRGPLNGSYKEYPKGYSMIMVDGPAPEEIRERELYARKIMRSFVSRAFRRPLDRGTVARLVKMAMDVDQSPGRSFEDGIKHAMTAVLASPRFLFRAEIQPEPNNSGKTVMLDEYALAARLSFFLWSSVPDDELLSLAFKNQLRKNLGAQIDRMIASSKSRRFVNNFVGQWLQARDVENIAIDANRVIGTKDQREADRIFNGRLRSDMKEESELFFEFILKKNRPLKELISARYSFLNERLAGFYGIPGVLGSEHRLVDLHEHPQRGGILGQGTFLLVTSNPTRTSPVKRGLFVLDNLLGTPAPPAPPDVPELEEVSEHNNKPLTMRQMMEVHRKKPLCASCHKRMDPIGLGLENFNAIGQFRSQESGQPIDSSGVLITGEKFSDIAALKSVLADERRDDFYRCLSEKILTYAIGRGPKYFDAVTIDALVRQLNEGDGTLKDLVITIIESVPFQKRRGG